MLITDRSRAIPVSWITVLAIVAILAFGGIVEAVDFRGSQTAPGEWTYTLTYHPMDNYSICQPNTTITISGLADVTEAYGPTSTDFPNPFGDQVNLQWIPEVLNGGTTVRWTHYGPGTGNWPIDLHVFGFKVLAPGATNGTISVTTDGFAYDSPECPDRDNVGTSNGPTDAATVASSFGYWRFEEGAADTLAIGTILDSSPQTDDGAPTGEPYFRADVPASAVPGTGATNGLSLDLDGFVDGAYFGSTFPFHDPGDVTIEFWIKNRSWQAQDLIWSRSDESDANRFNVFATGGSVGMDYRTPTGALVPLVQTPIPIDTWVHVAVTRTGNHYRLYLDGVLVDDSVDTVLDLPTASGWQISGRDTLAFNGLIDEIRLSDSALSPAEFLNATEGPSTATITCLAPNGGFTIDGDNFTVLTQGQTAEFEVLPEGSLFSLWSCGWGEPDCRYLEYLVMPGSTWEIVNVGGARIEMRMTSPPPCQLFLAVPIYDGQTWVYGCEAQVNGVVLSDDGCPEVVRIHWGWGDGTDNDNWFPAPHTYTTNGTYDVTVTPYDSEGGFTSETIQIEVTECAPPDLTEGLVAYYPFNGDSDDESGNGNHGLVYGAAPAADRFGLQGHAYSFDGMNDYIRVPRSSSLDITGPMTMAAWVYAYSVPPGVTAVVEKEISSMGYNIHLLEPSAVHIRVDGGIVEGGLIETNRWHFLAGVHDGTDLILYIDGDEIARTPEALPTLVPSKDLYIGAWQRSRIFDGLIDDVRLYDRPLSPMEIGLLFNLPPENSPPIAIDDGPWDVAEDSVLTALPSGVLANDSDPDDDDLSAILETQTSSGLVSLDPNGYFVYTPDPNYFGPDHFTYRASDGEFRSEPAIASFEVYSVNDPPVLDPVEDMSVFEADTLFIQLTATDIDHDVLDYWASGPPGAEIDPIAGRLYYTPEYDVSTANENAVFTVEFRVHDPQAAYSIQTAEITVVDINGGTPPGDDVMVIPEDPVTGTSPVSLTFEAVVDGGVTTVETTTAGPPPETGFRLGNNTYIEIHTEADYEPPIRLCFDYSSYGITGNRENRLRLYHLVPQDGFMNDGTQCTKPNGCWDDITDPDDPPDNPNPDTISDIICGTSNSLSLFAVVEGIEISAPLDPVEVDTAVIATLDLGDGTAADTALWDWGDSETAAATISTEGLVEGNHTYTEAGIHIVSLNLQKDGRDVGSAEFKYVVVYDPDGGFVTGGGWINSPEGAYPADPTLTGKANFGFVSKYKKGANVPTGKTEFRFKAARFGFRSTSYQWLVVAGPQAKFKGDGIVNGEGEYGFMLSARDGQRPGGGGEDAFRIKIWDKGTDEIVYDNQIDDDDDALPSTILGGGSIVIHK